MAQALIIEFESIGPILFERSNRAKRLNISVRPFKGVRVAVPFGTSMEYAEKIARTKTSWINRQLLRMSRIERDIESESSSAAPIDKEMAALQLSQRLDELAVRYGFSYNKVTIRNQKTLWGSCSAKNNISLNMRLVSLAPELIDYVILHELVHLKIKNHSEIFWRELQRLMPDARQLSKRLKHHRIASL